MIESESWIENVEWQCLGEEIGGSRFFLELKESVLIGDNCEGNEESLYLGGFVLCFVLEDGVESDLEILCPTEIVLDVIEFKKIRKMSEEEIVIEISEIFWDCTSFGEEVVIEGEIFKIGRSADEIEDALEMGKRVEIHNEWVHAR